MFDNIVRRGSYKGHKILCDGICYYIKVNGRRFAIDVNKTK